MCKWGTTRTMWYERKEKLVDVDSCIAPLVRGLWNAGVGTVASCCGHGKRPGNIALADGRELIIAPDFETARAVDRAFPPINEPDPEPVVVNIAADIRKFESGLRRARWATSALVFNIRGGWAKVARILHAWPRGRG